MSAYRSSTNKKWNGCLGSNSAVVFPALTTSIATPLLHPASSAGCHFLGVGTPAGPLSLADYCARDADRRRQYKPAAGARKLRLAVSSWRITF